MITKHKIMICMGLMVVSSLSLANVSSEPRKIAQTVFDKLLDVSPNDADEYIQLKQDIDYLSTVLIKTKQVHSDNIKVFSQHQEATNNEYNRNDKFILFNQLDNNVFKKDIDGSGYELKRVREKLHIASNRYRELEDAVKALYISKYAVDDNTLLNKLLAGDVVVFAKKQQQDVIEHLIAFQDEPQQMVKLFEHPNVVLLLPDYLKEQLRIFKEGNISLIDALSNKNVMVAVVKKLQAIDFFSDEAVSNTVTSVYGAKQMNAILEFDADTVFISSSITAGTINPLKTVELYDIPIPSKELVDQLSKLKGNSNLSRFSQRFIKQ